VVAFCAGSRIHMVREIEASLLSMAVSGRVEAGAVALA
jgi:hypothetical protein